MLPVLLLLLLLWLFLRLSLWLWLWLWRSLLHFYTVLSMFELPLGTDGERRAFFAHHGRL
jgi:hypothetical protein